MNDKEKADFLYQYYQDTLASIKRHLRERDLLFFLAVGLLTVQLLYIITPDGVSIAIISVLREKLGMLLTAEEGMFSNLLWLLMFIVTLRYFQRTVHVERLYVCTHRLEKRLSELLSEDVIDREGAGYLEEYPTISEWSHVVYVYVFPIALVVASIWKLIKEFPGCGNIGVSYLLSISCGLGIVVTTVLYLRFVRKESRRK